MRLSLILVKSRVKPAPSNLRVSVPPPPPGTRSDEIFVAGAGDDTLTGNGGMDVFNAGLGNDDIIINASNITALEQTGAGNRARVGGGGGTDTLKLEGAGLTLDLTKISDRRIQDIEVIDITGSGDNTLCSYLCKGLSEWLW
jgi:Ca2+-binding RTX toxin-like protein